MKILQTLIKPNGDITIEEIEVSDNYFDPAPAPDPGLRLDDLAAIVLDQEYRLTLIEMGVS